MILFKCKICGGALEINSDETVATCEYCGTKQTLPKLNDEKKANLFDRANHFRRNNDFDKAMSIYEQILNEDTEDAESYWSIVLCRYGIEYVEDPSSHKRVPTVNRAQFTSIFDDEDYKSAIKYADSYQKSIYEAEAAVINEIQKGILAISQKEEPFDVFICYKETDNSGRRTQDSVLATELYHELIKEGFKVFFSRITLEDKLGVAYEPYIFAALHSAKVMVVIGTKAEYFNAVWVKNEWSRYLSIIKNGADKILIPAYRDMDPYDLPEEFSHLQALDMSKLGFMQDLVRGVKKFVAANEPAAKETVVVQNNTSANASALIKRGFLALEDEEWNKADNFFEQALNQNAEDAQAYLGKLMVECKVKKQEDLKDCKYLFNDSPNYKKAVRFADKKLSAALEEYTAFISERSQKDFTYNQAVQLMQQNDIELLEKSIGYFESIEDWRDSKEKIAECRRKIEEDRMKKENERIAEENARIAKENERIAKKIKKRELIKKIVKKSRKIAIVAIPIMAILVVLGIIINSCILRTKYDKAMKLLDNGRKIEALAEFRKISDYKNSNELIKGIYKQVYDSKKHDGKKLSTGLEHTVGLKADGTVVAIGNNIDGQCNVSEWKDIAAVSTGFYHTIGLKTDGTVVAVGRNTNGQCNISDWQDILEVSAGANHTVGLKADGTVVAVGSNDDGQCNVSEWKDIVAVSAGANHTVGLKADGTVVAIGRNVDGQCNVSEWKDIVEVSTGFYHTIGLRADGTDIVVGYNKYGQCNVSDWGDIVAISAGSKHTVGLKADGTVVAAGSNGYGRCNVSDWKDIAAVSAGFYHTIGLKTDGTVVAIGDDKYGKCDVADWNLF